MQHAFADIEGACLVLPYGGTDVPTVGCPPAPITPITHVDAMSTLLEFYRAPVPRAHVAADGTILDCNQRFADLIGRTVPETRGSTFQSFTHPEDLTGDEEALADLLDDSTPDRGDTYTMDKRYLHKRGHSVWITLHVIAVRDQQSNAIAHLSVWAIPKQPMSSNVRVEADGHGGTTVRAESTVRTFLKQHWATLIPWAFTIGSALVAVIIWIYEVTKATGAGDG